MSYLDEFVNSVGYLPGEVSRSLELIKLLDDEAKLSTDDLSILSTKYFSTLEKDQGKVIENTEILQNIRAKQQKALNFSDEKIAVAKQLLDMIDYHTNKLKQDIDAYKKEVANENDNAEEKNKKKQKIEKNSLEMDMPMTMSMYIENPEMQDGFDIPNDENKTYCYCGKVSYGEMIECEGSTCKREWFHMECVGLTTQPGGSWYCDDCLETKKRASKS
ncbi:hypothetical protein SteCoe_10524 [Stentor coeruleus]|uniref:Inhibitor of growth protein n=1 Tax=Stentor coeruleus TaxID=5963 RepID=A0A1R2CFG1_9CILI|nr:hypothetical protein SteCoe_10524 [Stentor coeruleus]